MRSVPRLSPGPQGSLSSMGQAQQPAPQGSSCLEHLPDCRVSLPRDMGHNTGCRGRASGDCTKMYHEMLKGGGTVRKREGHRPATGHPKSENGSWGALVFPPMCVLGVCTWGHIHSPSGAAASGLLCPRANSWDAGSSYWAHWVSDPDAYWGEPYGVHAHKYIPTSRFSPWTARGEQGGVVGAVCVPVSAEFVSVLVCGASYVSVLKCGFYKGVCRCDYWEYKPSLTNSWTWGHRAAATSPLLSHGIWKA